MEQRYLGAGGLRVSRLGLGTLTWGRDTDVHEAHEMLDDFLAAGGSLVDVSGAYGDGAAAELLGELLTTMDVRDDVVLCAQAGSVGPPGGRTVDTSRGTLLDDLDLTLDRLGTDRVDLWLVSGADPEVPLAEIASALQAARDSGRARYVGIANLAGWQVGAVAALARELPLVAVQAEYSLLQRGVEREVAPAAQALGLGMLAWSPAGRGVLTGKYRNGTPADSRAASTHFASFVRPYLDTTSQRVVDAVVTAAEGLGRAPVEVAVAWVRQQPGVSAALVGPRNAAQLRGVLAGDDLHLPDQIRDALAEVSGPARDYPETASEPADRPARIVRR